MLESKPQRRVCSNCSSVAIIYRQDDPSQVMMQKKTRGVPYVVFTGDLCPAGGNGWGDVPDIGPRATLERELLREEVVGPAAALFTALFTNAQPWHAMLVPTSQKVADMARGNKRPALLTRVSYFTMPVDEVSWAELKSLQAAHPNLLTEGKSVITSLEDVLNDGARFAYGHDLAMELWWKSHGLDVTGMFVYPNGEAERVPWLDTYDAIFTDFEVERRPNRFMQAA